MPNLGDFGTIGNRSQAITSEGQTAGSRRDADVDSNGFGGNPLAGKANVTLDDLSNYDWIVGTPGAIRRIHFEKLFEGRPTVRLLTAKSLPRFRSAVRPVYSA